MIRFTTTPTEGRDGQTVPHDWCARCGGTGWVGDGRFLCPTHDRGTGLGCTRGWAPTIPTEHTTVTDGSAPIGDPLMPHPAVLAQDIRDGRRWGLSGYGGWQEDLMALRAVASTLTALGCTVDRHEPEEWTVHGPAGSVLGTVHATLTHGEGTEVTHDDGTRVTRWTMGVGYVASIPGDGSSQPYRHPGQAVLGILGRALIGR